MCSLSTSVIDASGGKSSESVGLWSKPFNKLFWSCLMPLTKPMRPRGNVLDVKCGGFGDEYERDVVGGRRRAATTKVRCGRGGRRRAAARSNMRRAGARDVSPEPVAVTRGSPLPAYFRDPSSARAAKVR